MDTNYYNITYFFCKTCTMYIFIYTVSLAAIKAPNKIKQLL